MKNRWLIWWKEGWNRDVLGESLGLRVAALRRLVRIDIPVWIGRIGLDGNSFLVPIHHGSCIDGRKGKKLMAA